MLDEAPEDEGAAVDDEILVVSGIRHVMAVLEMHRERAAGRRGRGRSLRLRGRVFRLAPALRGPPRVPAPLDRGRSQVQTADSRHGAEPPPRPCAPPPPAAGPSRPGRASASTPTWARPSRNSARCRRHPVAAGQGLRRLRRPHLRRARRRRRHGTGDHRSVPVLAPRRRTSSHDTARAGEALDLKELTPAGATAATTARSPRATPRTSSATCWPTLPRAGCW